MKAEGRFHCRTAAIEKYAKTSVRRATKSSEEGAKNPRRGLPGGMEGGPCWKEAQRRIFILCQMAHSDDDSHLPIRCRSVLALAWCAQA